MGFFFKKKKGTVCAIANGTSLAIEKVPDEVFSTKMMGDGIAFKPSDGNICAPCDGEISLVMDRTKHAVGIKNGDGIEFLIHVGLDTVNLEGEGFEVLVNVGDKVKAKDLLIKFDKQLLKEKGVDDTSMLIIVDPNNKKFTDYHHDISTIAGETVILEYK